MAYSNKNYSSTNIDYLNKDFLSIRETLIEYAKTYFPNSYKDFNETSPGMMLIEMSAYVGDVLSFYIDQQYKEMLLPLAEERKNIINIANMLGYKVKPTTPAFVNLQITQNVGFIQEGKNRKPNFEDALILDKGLRVKSNSNSTIFFETLEPVDFTVSGSVLPEPVVFDATSNQVTEFKLTRSVRAVSGKTKTKTFTIGSPTKFTKLTLPETDVFEIISVFDDKTNRDNPSGNRYYEVDYLAQDRVPIETFYLDDEDRTSAYSPIGVIDSTNPNLTVPIPFKLEFIATSKRFVTEIDENNNTSLVFGNGVLNNQTIPESNFLQLEQAGVTLPGQASDLITEPIDPLINAENKTLGEAPSNTVLTVNYRTGGGIESNVTSCDLTIFDNLPATSRNGKDTSDKTLTITNSSPAEGGSAGETIEQIKIDTRDGTYVGRSKE